MKSSRKKIRSIGLWIFSICMILFVGAIICVRASVFPIPEASVTYDSDNDWEGTLVIDQNETVKISGITHENTGTYASAIKICGNSEVNLVFEGDNVLSGNSSVISAGIEVEEGSTVNIYGMEGSSLVVTGGMISAGIGGLGSSSVSPTNPKAGKINIYSGNITAIGGSKGAGIGSGYHSSATVINIKGGNIIALGSGSGAGIGTGYGTSGGAAVAAGVGFYNGGDITISGGVVKAAAYHINFDNFDPYNTETLYGDGYENTFAAGIGGGYGASSGNIVIEGDADVTAIGSCGGAGIGSGRGTSKASNYDSENFNVNITIRGDSKVIAMATDDTRESVTGDDGGAAIGLGRGCTLENGPKGTIVIEGNASVYAVAPDHAQAIGGSCVVGKFSKDEEGNIIRPAAAHVQSLTIGVNSIVMAVGDEYREAIDREFAANFLLINMSKNYFESRNDFFTEDKFPLKIDVVNADNINSKATFSVQKPKTLNIMVYILGAEKYNFIVKDYQGENGEKIFLSNSVEDNSAQFFPDPTQVKEYDVTGLTARLDRDESMESDYGILSFKIGAKEGIFEYGSTFFCNRIEDQSVIDDLNSKLDKKYADKLERILYFDIGVKDRNGENYSEFKGGKVKIYVEVPEGWDKDEVLALFVKSLDDEDFKDTQRLEVIDGITYVSFEIDHFSSYALFDPKKEEEEHEEEQKKSHDEGNGEENNSLENDEEDSTKNDLVKFFLTGDNSRYMVLILLILLIISLFMIRSLFEKPAKHFKK